MSDIISIPLKLLVVSTSRVPELINPFYSEKSLKFETFCMAHGASPLYLKDTFGIVQFIIEEGCMLLDWAPSETFRSYCRKINDKLSENGLQDDNVVVFRVGDFATASKIFLNINSLDYFNKSIITDIKFLCDDRKIVDLVYVSMN
jgi:hypothetical protein